MVDRFDLDQAGMNCPVADALQPGEPFFGRFDRPFRRARSADDDRALATPEQPIVARDLIEKTNAIAGHGRPLSRSLTQLGWPAYDLVKNR